MAQTLPGALAWWARMRPDQLALVLDSDSLTYRELKAWSDRIAAMLIDDGIQAGDRVSICALNSLAYCALILGVIRAGAIVSSVNFRYTAREISDLCDEVEPRVAFAAPEFAQKMAAGCGAVRLLSEVEALRHGPDVTVTRDVEVDAPVVIIATSGSTARPKGVVLTNRSTTAYAGNWAVEETYCAPGSCAIALAPLSTSAGFVHLTYYMTMGCTTYMHSEFVPTKVLKTLVEKRINAFAAVPLFFEALATLPEFADADLSALTLATCGGARVSRQLLETYNAKGVVLRQLYGQTEVGGSATIMPAHLALEFPDKCGWGGVFVDVRVVRPDGVDCDPEEPGEIIMRSPGMMIGYWRNPEETAKALRDGWLYSGDIGVLDDQGLLTFMDRMKDLVISGGLNISAAEVERIVCEFPGVLEALVIAAPDTKFGETPMVVYHAEREIDVSALIEYCNANLSNYKVPRFVAFSATPLPRLATGKLSKPAVRLAYANAHHTLARVR